MAAWSSTQPWVGLTGWGTDTQSPTSGPGWVSTDPWVSSQAWGATTPTSGPGWVSTDPWVSSQAWGATTPVEGTLARHGTGSLTLGGSPRVPRALARTGSRALALSAAPRAGSALSRSSTGALALQGVPGGAGGLSRAGRGSLALSGISGGVGTLALTGQGDLSLAAVSIVVTTEWRNELINPSFVTGTGNLSATRYTKAAITWHDGVRTGARLARTDTATAYLYESPGAGYSVPQAVGRFHPDPDAAYLMRITVYNPDVKPQAIRPTLVGYAWTGSAWTGSGGSITATGPDPEHPDGTSGYFLIPPGVERTVTVVIPMGRFTDTTQGVLPIWYVYDATGWPAVQSAQALGTLIDVTGLQFTLVPAGTAAASVPYVGADTGAGSYIGTPGASPSTLTGQGMLRVGTGVLFLGGAATGRNSIATAGTGTLNLASDARPAATLVRAGSHTLRLTASTKTSGGLATSGTGALAYIAAPRLSGGLATSGAGALALTGTTHPMGAFNRIGASTLALTGASAATAGLLVASVATLRFASTIRASRTLTLLRAHVLTLSARPGGAGAITLTATSAVALSATANAQARLALNGRTTLALRQPPVPNDITVRIGASRSLTQVAGTRLAVIDVAIDATQARELVTIGATRTEREGSP